MYTNMKNKVMVISGGVAVFMLFAVAGIALAADMTGGAAMHGDKPSSMMMMQPPAPMVLTVLSSGQGRIRGVVASVGVNSLTIAAWGGTWTVNVTSSTVVSPQNDLSKIVVGDFVGVTGMVSEDSPTITADHIRDWTAKSAMMHSDTNTGNHMMASSTMMH